MKTARPRIPETEYSAAKTAANIAGISVEKWFVQAIREKYIRDGVGETLNKIDAEIRGEG